MKQKSLNKTATKLKYYAYSVVLNFYDKLLTVYVKNLYSLQHDTTLIALQSNLDVYDGAAPVYAELLLFELYEQDGKFLVEVSDW